MDNDQIFLTDQEEKAAGKTILPERVDDLSAEEQELIRQQNELAAKLRELRIKKYEAERLEAAERERIRLKELEEKRQRELEKPIIVTIKSLAGGMVVIDSDYREDLVALLRSIPGRAYRGSRENQIPIAELESFVTKAQNMKNTSVIYNEIAERDIKFYLSAAKWAIELKPKYLQVVPGPRANSYQIYKIPGAEWVRDKNEWKVPLSEAWRLWEHLQEEEGVVYSDEARDFTIKQVEQRANIDKIAQLEDIDYEVELKNGVLRSFQRVGCAFTEAAGGRALLAYEMGLGKTWMALAYAIKNKLRTVIICPASLKPNWCREIYSLTGMRPNVILGSTPTKYDMVTMLTSPSQFTVINYDLIGAKAEGKDITTDTEGYKHEKPWKSFLWVETINMCKPDLLVFDESHYIKNTDSNRSQACREMKAPHIIHMTGTPVLNRPGELWPILTMLQPEQFPSEELFIKQYTYDGKTARNVEELRNLMKSIMIRRLKKDVIQDMPLINRMNEWHELSKKANKLYQKVLQGVYESIAEYNPSGIGGESKKVANILAQIQRLKMICAIDKVDRTADLATRLYDETDESEPRKVLIFSQYKAVAWRIANLLGQEALCFVDKTPTDFKTVDDNERDSRVQKFQTDPSIHFLVVTEKTAKEGHNITAAGHVIFNDLFWTPAGHEQGEGRAYGRLSDLHGINSYYVVTDMNGEGIEEWINELLRRKMGVIEEVVEGVEASRSDESIFADLIEKMRGAMWSRSKK